MKMYSVQQVAKLLDLHPKTVRRFIREGVLKAHKIGREWRVQQVDLAAYAHAELANIPPEPVSTTPLNDRVRFSAAIELEESRSDEVTRISNTLVAMLNGKDPAWGPASYELTYHPEHHKARFVVYGTPAFLRATLELLANLQQPSGTNGRDAAEGGRYVE